ncbi:hypothetical protein V1289_008074 [Bradyrhizobium sp. AZCC 2289]
MAKTKTPPSLVPVVSYGYDPAASAIPTPDMISAR